MKRLNILTLMIPAFLSALAGVFFLRVPGAAVFLAVSVCFGFSLVYTGIIFKFLGARQNFNKPPTFKNVTVFMSKKGKTWTSEI